MPRKKRKSTTKKRQYNSTKRPIYAPNLHPKLAKQFCIVRKCTDEELAKLLEISIHTLYKWRSIHPEFKESIDEGKQFTDDEVAVSGLLKRALGYEYEEADIKVVTKTITVGKNKTGIEEKTTKKIFKRTLPPDVRAGEFWLRNRQKHLWRDHISQELTGPDGLPLNLNPNGKVTIYVPDNKRDPKLQKVETKK